jgi:hypothetical protein
MDLAMTSRTKMCFDSVAQRGPGAVESDRGLVEISITSVVKDASLQAKIVGVGFRLKWKVLAIRTLAPGVLGIVVVWRQRQSVVLHLQACGVRGKA